MSKLRVKKLESIGGPLEIVGNNIIFSGNVTIGGNIQIIGTLTGSNINNTFVNNIPIESSIGENSIKQKGDSDFQNFGSNSASLGDFNSSNGDYSNASGSYNVTGSKQYDFTKINDINYLIILGKNAYNDFVTGNTKIYQTTINTLTGTTTTTSTTVTYQSEIIPYLNDCNKYFINNNVIIPGNIFYLEYVDCEGNSGTTSSMGSYNICSKIIPKIPSQFSSYPQISALTITLTGYCCTSLVRTSAFTINDISTTTTNLMVSSAASDCYVYTIEYPIISNSNGTLLPINIIYSACSGFQKNLLINVGETKRICALKNSIFIGRNATRLIIENENINCCPSYEIKNISNSVLSWNVTDCCSNRSRIINIFPGVTKIVSSNTPPPFNTNNAIVGDSDKFCEAYVYTYTNTTQIINSGITITTACTDSSLISTGNCVTYKFENNNTTPSMSNNIFWTDCYGVPRSLKLGIGCGESKINVCAKKNSTYADNGITVTQVYSGCCLIENSKYNPILIESIYDFSGGTLGHANAAYIISINGVIYGFAEINSTSTTDCIFSCDTNGNNFEVLHNFNFYSLSQGGSMDGNGAEKGGLYLASNGKLYSTLFTTGDVNGLNLGGSIFSYDVNNRQYTLLNYFSKNTNILLSNIIGFRSGTNALIEPTTNLGNLYGITNLGTIFKYDITANTITELMYISGLSQVQMYELTPGVLYGSTFNGGLYNLGTIFSYEISSNTYTIIHNFSGLDGRGNISRKWAVKNNTLYGVSNFGGSNGFGALYSYSMISGFTKIHDYCYSIFYSRGEAIRPETIMLASDGKLYMTGNNLITNTMNCGYISSYDLNTKTLQTISGYQFGGGPQTTTFCRPYNSLIEINGILYGSTYFGGSHQSGTIYKFEIPKCTDNLTYIQYKTNDNRREISFIGSKNSNAKIIDINNNKYDVEILSITTGNTTYNRSIIENIFELFDLPENINYTILEINSDLSNFYGGIIVSNYYGDSASVEGFETQAKGNASHSEGFGTLTNGDFSHAEGINTIANAEGSHSEGIGTITKGTASHAMGINAITNNTGEFAMSNGISQYSMLLVNGYTTGNTSSELFVDGFTERLILEKNTFMYLTIDATAIITSNTGKDFTGSGFVLRLGPSPVSVGFTGQTMTGLLNNTNIQSFEGNYPLITVTVNYVNEDYNEFIFTANGNNVGMTFKWSVGLTIVKNKI